MRGLLKLPAGALQFVLFIGAIIAVLLLTFVLISHSHSHFNKKTDLTVEVLLAADYGLQYAFGTQLKSGDSLLLPPYGLSEIGIQVQKTYWGVIQKWHSKAKHRAIAFEKTALVGTESNTDTTALYLRDRQRPLVLAGKSKLTGNVYLPKQGLRMGNIAGNAYLHKQLVYGEQRLSQEQLPPLDREILEQIHYLTQPDFQPQGEVVTLRPGLELQNSFASPPTYIQDNNITLEGVTLTGNIVVHALHSITVHPNTHLKDVLLIAPEIRIKDGVTGYFQAIASKQIIVGKLCRLYYPTALVVQPRLDAPIQNPIDLEPNIFIDTGSEVHGILLYLEDSEGYKHVPQIHIAEGSTILGEIYCTKNLELKGSVLGRVYTDAFIALENGSIYQNHLYRGTIDRSGLPDTHVGLPLDTDSAQNYMKWMY